MCPPALTHFVATTLSITDPWALTDTCKSTRARAHTHTHTHTHTQTHIVKHKPPADCPLPHHNASLIPSLPRGRNFIEPILCARHV